MLEITTKKAICESCKRFMEAMLEDASTVAQK